MIKKKEDANSSEFSLDLGVGLWRLLKISLAEGDTGTNTKSDFSYIVLFLASLDCFLRALGRSYVVERSMLDCLQGHKDKSVSASYERDEYGSVYSLKTLYDAILKIDVFNDL